MNKRGLEDSFFTWVFAFLFIAFFMLVYLFGVFAMSGKSSLFNFLSGEAVIVEEGSKDLILNKKFLSFLNSEVEFEDGEKKIIDAIKESLDDYFEIKNNKGKSFIEVLGVEGIDYEDLAVRNNKLIGKDFSQAAFSELAEITRRYEEDGFFLNKVQKEFGEICSKYRFKTPLGMVSEHGFRAGSYSENSLISKEEETSFDWTPVIIHKNNYRGENFEIKFRMLEKCVGGFENDELE